MIALQRGKSPSGHLNHDGVLASLFDAEHERLLRAAYLLLRDREAAEDVVQEAFLRFHQARHRLRHPRNAPAYLRATVVNLARGRMRRAGVAERHADALAQGARAQVSTADAAASADRIDDRRTVMHAIGTLPTRQRECVVLRYYLDLTDGQVAETLGISTGAVKQHLHRALATLNPALEAVR